MFIKLRIYRQFNLSNNFQCNYSNATLKGDYVEELSHTSFCRYDIILTISAILTKRFN